MDTVYAPSTGLYLPGVITDYISTPDHASLDITEDIAFVFKGIFAASTNLDFFSRSGSDPNRCFRVYQTSSNVLTMSIFPSGSAASLITFTFTAGIHNDWDDLGITLDLNNGSFNSVATLFGKLATESSYTILDSNSKSVITSLPSITRELNIGYPATVGSFAGVVSYFALYSGIGDNSQPNLGTLIAEFDASKCKPRYRDSTGKVWSIIGSDVVTERVYNA